MSKQTDAHFLVVTKIQRLMISYDKLPPHIKKEVLHFLSTPQMITNLKLSPRNNSTKSKEIGSKYFYLV